MTNVMHAPHVDRSDGADPEFPECEADPVFGATYLHEIYTKSDPSYTGAPP